jgi:hypothetical protein
MSRLTTPMKALIAVGGVLSLGMAAIISVPLLMVMGNTAVMGAGDSLSDEAISSTFSMDVGSHRITLTAENVTNARTIITTGKELKIPTRGLQIAIATAMQESRLDNLEGGDRDSVGLFQQRNAWGTKAERTDQTTATTMFFEGGHGGQPGLLDIRRWEQMPLTLAAQKVQRSAYPLAYAQWETFASTLVELVVNNQPIGAIDPVAYGLPSGPVGVMLQVAQEQVGKPYVFGAIGPDSFDCSGLIVYSWRQAGYRVNVRTAAAMYNASTPVAWGSEQPGDMLFGEFGTRVPGAGHVLIVVRPGLAVQAPATGQNVKMTDYTIPYYKNWKLARFKQSTLTKLGEAA